MARNITKAFPAVLAAALFFFLTRPASAGCSPCGCMGWCSAPRPSFPTGSPCFGYNKTVWQAWPAACTNAQPATLAQPVPADAPAADSASRPDDWANMRHNDGGRLPELHPLVAKPATSPPAALGESAYHALEPVSAPQR